MNYLGRYTHRVAISNSRILRIDETTVTIKVKEYKSGGQWKELTLDGVEFVRRFLMHVPPKGFVRIRHYGIFSNQNKRKLIPICRNLIGCREFLKRFRKDDKTQRLTLKQPDIGHKDLGVRGEVCLKTEKFFQNRNKKYLKQPPENGRWRH